MQFACLCSCKYEQANPHKIVFYPECLIPPPFPSLTRPNNIPSLSLIAFFNVFSHSIYLQTAYLTILNINQELIGAGCLIYCCTGCPGVVQHQASRPLCTPLSCANFSSKLFLFLVIMLFLKCYFYCNHFDFAYLHYKKIVKFDKEF